MLQFSTIEGITKRALYLLDKLGQCQDYFILYGYVQELSEIEKIVGPDKYLQLHKLHKQKIMEIKELRLMIDTFMNSVKDLEKSREVSLCYTYLQRSFSWLGEALKESGSQSPYKESENPNSPVIEPQADHTEETIWSGPDGLDDYTQTAKVKFFRASLEIAIQAFKKLRMESANSGSDLDACLSESYKSLKDAKMCLGWELNRIIS